MSLYLAEKNISALKWRSVAFTAPAGSEAAVVAIDDENWAEVPVLLSV